MGRKRKQRRQPHGSAWHWKQTDCWYYTVSGTKKRMALFDEDGKRIRGKKNKEAAELALAKVKLAEDGEATGGPAGNQQWLVAKVCSDYLQYCQRGVAGGTISKGHFGNKNHSTPPWHHTIHECCNTSLNLRMAIQDRIRQFDRNCRRALGSSSAREGGWVGSVQDLTLLGSALDLMSLALDSELVWWERSGRM